MSYSKLASFSIASVLCLAVVAPALTFASAPVAANHGDEPGSYVATQGDRCVDVAVLGDGETTVEEFYGYSPTASNGYGSTGTPDLQQSQVSQLFVYHGQNGMSLVFLHDEIGDEDRGGAVTMTIDGLPEDGEWPVQDDNYTRDGSEQDDNFAHDGTSSTIDWMWYESRMDGGAFRGLGGLDGAITIDAAFGEDSYAAEEENWDAASHEVDWYVRYGEGDDDLEQLDENRTLSIERGSCGSGERTANLTASPDETTVGESVILDASDSTVEDVAVFHWDVDGDDTVDETTEASTLDTAYETDGTFEPTVFVENYDGENATATTTVNVSDETSPEASASASPTTVTPGENVTFDATGSSDNVGITEYNWTFDDDTSADGDVVTHAYEENGTYNVTLTVTDGAGNSDTHNETVTVEEIDDPPTANLHVRATATQGENVTFDASNSSDDEAIVEYRWDVYDDGSVDTSTQEPVLERPISSTGNLTVNVTVVDAGGQIAADTAMVTVEADDSDETDDSDNSDSSDDSDQSDDSDESDNSNDSGDTNDSGDSGNGNANTGGATGSTSGVVSSGVDDEPSADVTRSDDGTLLVTVENAVEGEAVSADVPTGESHAWLRAVELVPANDADQLTVTLVPRDNVSAPNGTDAGLYELEVRNASAVENVTYRFAVNRSELGERGELRVLAGDGTSAATVEHAVVENGSTLVVDATAGDAERVVLAAVAPNVSASSITTGDAVATGRPVSVETMLTNVGHAAANRTVELTVDGTVVDSKNVTVPANGETNVSFQTRFDSAGDRRVSVAGTERTVSVASPGEFVELADVSLDRTQVPAGEQVAVTATFENTGESNATVQANFSVAGDVVDTESVAVEPGETVTTTFTRSIDDPGEYAVAVNGEQKTVDVGDSDTPSTDTETPDDSSTNSQNTGLAVAGLGVLIIGAAALIRVL